MKAATFVAMVRDRRIPNLTGRQIAALLWLQLSPAEDRRVGLVAAALRVPLPTVTRMFDKLEHSGLIVTWRGADRRTRHAGFTEKGQAITEMLAGRS